MKAKDVKFDKLRPVFFGFNAIAIFEDESGIKMADIGEALAGMSTKTLITFVWAGLVGGAKKVGNEVDFTLDDVGNWLDEVEDIEKVFNTYIQCMPMATGEAVESKKK